MQSDHDFAVSQAGYTISAALFRIGPDVLIVVTGGDHPHVGDVTTKSQHAPLQTVKFPSHDGRDHKDNFLSDRLADTVSSQVGGSLTVLAGVHIDGITQAQIKASAEMIDRLADQINQWLAAHPAHINPPTYYDQNHHPE